MRGLTADFDPRWLLNDEKVSRGLGGRDEEFPILWAASNIHLLTNDIIFVVTIHSESSLLDCPP